MYNATTTKTEINGELTTTLTGKQTTLTGSTLSGFLNTTNDFVCNATTSKQSTLTSNTLSGLLNTTDDFVYNTTTTKIDFSKNTSNYVWNTSNILVKRITDEVGYKSNYISRLDGNSNNYVWNTSNILVK